MAAGRLRDRVTFQREVSIPDGGGGSVTSWQTFLTVWGGFAPERASERLEAGRIEAAVAGRLTIRSSTDARVITTADRVMIDDVPHEIRSITNPDRRNKFLEMVVERGVAT